MNTVTFFPDGSNNDKIKQHINQCIDDIREYMLKCVDQKIAVSIHQNQLTDAHLVSGFIADTPTCLLGCTYGISVGQYVVEKK